MSYSTTLYAKALADILAKKPADIQQLTERFLTLLQSNGDLQKADAIIEATQKELLRQSGNKTVRIETARTVNDSALRKRWVKKGDIVETIVHPELIAGVRVTVNDERQLDVSLKKQLETLFRSL